MSRQNFNQGQEIIAEDLNALQGRLERGNFDDVIYHLLGRKSNAFFQDGFLVSRTSSTTVLVKAGLGFIEADTGAKEPIRKPLILRSDESITIDTPDSSNPRIDIVVVKNERIDKNSEARKFKDEFTDQISTQTFVISTDWESDLQYIAGTPEASPSAPAVPAGYLKVSTIQVDASTGIPAAGVTDERQKLPIATGLTGTGSSEYDAIVGTIGVDQGANYADIKSALDNALNGWRILVLRDQTIDSTPIVADDSIEIHFKRGVSMIKGTANTGLQIDGDDCKITGARFTDFSVTGDFGILVSASAARTYLDAPRFNNCDGNIDDNGSQTYINVEYTE